MIPHKEKIASLGNVVASAKEDCHYYFQSDQSNGLTT